MISGVKVIAVGGRIETAQVSKSSTPNLSGIVGIGDLCIGGFQESVNGLSSSCGRGNGWGCRNVSVTGAQSFDNMAIAPPVPVEHPACEGFTVRFGTECSVGLLGSIGDLEDRSGGR